MSEFPSYTYVPGHWPHPTRHPDGHAVGEVEPPPVALVPDRWAECPEYLLGFRLFDAGYYWEAHEAWEGVWKASPRAGAEENLLRGLAQFAAGALKVRQDKARTTHVFAKKCTARFERAMELGGSPFAGLDLEELIRRVAQFDAAADAMPFDPAEPVEVLMEPLPVVR
jgi:hypothetical protein